MPSIKGLKKIKSQREFWPLQNDAQCSYVVPTEDNILVKLHISGFLKKCGFVFFFLICVAEVMEIHRKHENAGVKLISANFPKNGF